MRKADYIFEKVALSADLLGRAAMKRFAGGHIDSAVKLHAYGLGKGTGTSPMKEILMERVMESPGNRDLFAETMAFGRPAGSYDNRMFDKALQISRDSKGVAIDKSGLATFKQHLDDAGKIPYSSSAIKEQQSRLSAIRGNKAEAARAKKRLDDIDEFRSFLGI